ncbi:MAG: hypothetical protein JNK15_17910 [Planctomycetes bacterium]|nr:hypothetical protein [Planctomycetota bacterium]
MRPIPFVVLLSLLAHAHAQVALPTGGQRFVDFSAHLAHPGVCVVVGTLDGWKEGKRERLADGQLGGGGAVASVSGTQFFKVQVTAGVKVRTTFVGKPTDVKLQFEVQLARLPDGKERRQIAGGAELADDQLALFVFTPAKKKGHVLCAAVPYDPKEEKGGEAAFVDSMRDYYVVNQRMADLVRALDGFDKAPDDAAKKAAAVALRELLDKKPELKVGKNDGLLTMHCGPLEARAQKRLADAAAADAAKAGDGK